MEERSKTNKEIFEQEYPLEEVSHNAFKCAEAIGYLKGLIQHFPNEVKWVDSKMSDLLLIMIFHSLK